MKNNPLLPHELPDDRDLQHEGLPSLADTVPLDMTSGARIQDSASAIEPRSQRLHVYNDGEVVIDLVIFYKEWGDGKKCLVTFEPIGRVQKGGAPITRERFLLEKPVPRISLATLGVTSEVLTAKQARRSCTNPSKIRSTIISAI